MSRSLGNTIADSLQLSLAYAERLLSGITPEIYPDMAEVTTAYFDGYRAVLASLQNASDETLQQANPLGGGMTERFPTLGSMYAFYVGGHMMLHLGQLSAWRRMMGLEPA